MNIQEFGQKCKGLLQNDDVFTATLLVLVGVTSFGLGQASVDVSEGNFEQIISISEQSVGAENITGASYTTSSVGGVQGAYVASVSGSRYHLPECPSAQTIKEENKIWFDTKVDAERAGYTPAQNCEGM